MQFFCHSQPSENACQHFAAGFRFHPANPEEKGEDADISQFGAVDHLFIPVCPH